MKKSDDLKLSVTRVNELEKASCRENDSQIKKLCNGTILTQGLQGLKGESEIKTIDYIIDCDADPFIPEGWSVFRHKPGGKINFSVSKFSLYLPEQQNGRVICGFDLVKEIKKTAKSVLNANVLDFFLNHQGLIPDEWKERYIFFWSTLYEESLKQLVVRNLFWNKTYWDWNYCYLSNIFNSDDFSLLLSESNNQS